MTLHVVLRMPSFKRGILVNNVLEALFYLFLIRLALHNTYYSNNNNDILHRYQ